MMKLERIGRVVIGVIVLCIAAGARGESYRDDGANFTIELPPGWRAMAPGRLAAINQEAARLAAGMRVEYSAGFESSDRSSKLPPYVLVQSSGTGAMTGTYDEIEAEIDRGTKVGLEQARDAMGDALGDLRMGEGKLDRTKNRYVTRNQMQLPGIGNLNSVTYGMLGRNRLVFVHCYAVESNFAAAAPSFKAIADGFRYDAGHEFQPSTGSRFWTGVMGKALIGGIVGGLIGLVAWIVKKMQRTSADS